MRITGNAKIAGLIYAGRGLSMSGNPNIQGIIVADGKAEIAGNLGNTGTTAEEFLWWLKPEED